MIDSRTRSILKTLSYRILAMGATMLVTYLFTREIEIAVGVAVADAAVKIMLYYGHERLWIRRG